jgi:hypothetical protein
VRAVRAQILSFIALTPALLRCTGDFQQVRR